MGASSPPRFKAQPLSLKVGALVHRWPGLVRAASSDWLVPSPKPPICPRREGRPRIMAASEAAMTIEQDYVERHPGSARLYERAGKVLPSGVTHDSRFMRPFPLYAERAAGAHKWDVDGHEHIDYVVGTAHSCLATITPRSPKRRRPSLLVARTTAPATSSRSNGPKQSSASCPPPKWCGSRVPARKQP